MVIEALPEFVKFTMLVVFQVGHEVKIGLMGIGS